MLSRNGASFSTIGALRNLDWWNLVRGLIGLKDRAKRSLYWLVCVSPVYKHLGNLRIRLADRARRRCSVVNEYDIQCVCGLLIIPSIVSKVSFAPVSLTVISQVYTFVLSYNYSRVTCCPKLLVKAVLLRQLYSNKQASFHRKAQC